jgi:hypothetical protein
VVFSLRYVQEQFGQDFIVVADTWLLLFSSDVSRHNLRHLRRDLAWSESLDKIVIVQVTNIAVTGSGTVREPRRRERPPLEAVSRGQVEEVGSED